MNNLTPEEKTFKESLENFHPPITPKGWDNIESQLPKKTGSSFFGGSAILAVITLISIATFLNSHEEEFAKPKSEITTKNNKINKIFNTKNNTEDQIQKESKAANPNSNFKIDDNKILNNKSSEKVNEDYTAFKEKINKETTTSNLINEDKERNNELATYEIFASTNVICEGEEIQVIGNIPSKNIESIIWNFGDGNLSTEFNSSHTYENNGEYIISSEVELKNGNILKTVLKDRIIVKKSPALNYSINKTNKDAFCPLISFTNDSENIVKTDWILDGKNYFSDNSFNCSVFEKGEHEVEISCTNKNGCTSKEKTNFKVLLDASLPNVFSPNNDGNNDTWIPFILLNNDYEFELSVMTKNGKLAYKTTDKNNPWDGRINNSSTKAQIGDVFIWIANIKENNNIKQIGGTVTVL